MHKTVIVQTRITNTVFLTKLHKMNHTKTIMLKQVSKTIVKNNYTKTAKASVQK